MSERDYGYGDDTPINCWCGAPMHPRLHTHTREIDMQTHKVALAQRELDQHRRQVKWWEATLDRERRLLGEMTDKQIEREGRRRRG